MMQPSRAKKPAVVTNTFFVTTWKLQFKTQNNTFYDKYDTLKYLKAYWQLHQIYMYTAAWPN